MAYEIDTFDVKPAGVTGANSHLASDGTSIWVSNRNNGGSANGYITRLRVTDGTPLNWTTGIPDTLANSQIKFPGAFPNDHFPAAMTVTGGILWVGVFGSNSYYLKGYTIATGVLTFDYNTGINGGANPLPAGKVAFFASNLDAVTVNGIGYFFTDGGNFGGNSRGILVRVNASGYLDAVSYGETYTGFRNVCFDGTNLWVATTVVAGGLLRFVQFNTSGAATGVVADCGLGTPAGLWWDGGSYVWASVGGLLAKFRISDGYFIRSDTGAAVATYSAATCMYVGPTYAGGSGYVNSLQFDGNAVWCGGGSVSWTFNPTRNKWDVVINADITVQYQMLFDGTYVWMTSNTTGGGKLYRVYAVVIPKLTDVSPGAGPHLSLTFDSPVGIVGPTIGPASGELGITGASQISTTQIDLACVVTPIAPKIATAKANANGVDLVFDRPVDLAATPDYGTTVNNLRVVTANPLSTTEVQLFTTVTSNTYEWLSTPIVVTGVGVLPHVVAAWAESSTTFVLIFNEAVVESSAVNIANYAITPALDIISIEKMDSTTYRMHTSQQTGNTTYYVTLTGVIDPANNPI